MDPKQVPTCVRCSKPLIALGEKHLQTMGILEQYIEVVMMHCPQCGHVEFFKDPPFDWKSTMKRKSR